MVKNNIIEEIREEYLIDKSYVLNRINGPCDCLTLSCISNPNIFVIKYLITESGEQNLSVDSINFAIKYNPNLMVIKYMIEKTNFEYMIDILPFQRFILILPIITENYYRFNEFLNKGIIKYGKQPMIHWINLINPLMINKINMNIFQYLY